MERLDFLGGSISTRYHVSGDLPRLPDGSISGLYKKEHSEVAGFDYEAGYAKVLSKSHPGDENFTHIREYGFGGLDTVFSPYSVYFSDPFLPHFEAPDTDSLTVPNSLRLNPFNPNNRLSLYYASTGSDIYQISGTGTLGIPTAEESGLLDNPSGWLLHGHNIEYASVGTGEFDGQPVNMNFAQDYNRRGRVEVEQIRSIGLRSPVVLTGWGYDTAGNPVPAATGDATEFHEDAFKDPTLWKSGPIDVRWNDSRKVWQASGGGADIIKFSVVDANPEIGIGASDCDFVTATVTHVGCDTEGVVVGDTVNIWDVNLCWFNMPLDLLTNMAGTAERMTNPWYDPLYEGDVADCIPTAYAEGPCWWVVTALCCREEINFV